jgi:UDP-N-acetylmuramyl pentapeptide phosphotransferase/UDP-N-acetylglucosamine-1-phosphate transferase
MMSMLDVLTLAATATVFVVALLLTQRLCDPTSRFHVLDHPNERSLHTRPTPRSGGLAIVVPVTVAWVAGTLVLDEPGRFMALLLPGLLVAGVSLADDHYGIGILPRFAVHTGAGAALVLSGFGWPAELWPGVVSSLAAPVAVVAAVAFIVWMVNLYNFMDGMDGFAGGMAIFGFGGLALLGWQGGHAAFAFAAATVAAAAAGFLVFNFPPARIFMGDIGSSFLGMTAAGFSLWGAGGGFVPFWIAILLFSPFIVDATFTLLRRAARGERVWEAHRTHVYQRLVQAGWGHRRTVLTEYALMAACLGTALVAAGRPPPWQRTAALGWIILYAGLIALAAWVDRRASAPGRNG